ncbi:MAG: efflux RND transporter periplasmic adaptor subunit [Verrucomicrobiales bacterium]|nr:efflux RND transporter periplasmic adaptor subunit [Verrucomicrobiales bacterium]
MRAVILSLLILAGGGGAFFWWRSHEAKSTNGTGANGASARESTATVQLGNVNFAVTVAGEIGPAEQVSVRPEVNGRIKELPVDVGDRVEKGGLLFSLDDRDLRIESESREKQIESARLQLDKARISMEQARRDFERDNQLAELKLLSEQAFETTRQKFDSAIKDHELAKNSIERSQQELLLAQERLQKTRIVAPFACTVLTRPVSIGQAVSGSGGFNSGTEVLTIADLSSMVINAHVNQADVTRLQQGMNVNITVDAIPGLAISGQVERIAPQATVKNNIKGYATRIVLKDLESRIQPGMTASITIPVAAADDVLTVPLAAIFSEQGDRYVYVKTGDTFERRPVVVGISDFFNAEIKSGLAVGDVISLEAPANAAATATTTAATGPNGARPGAPAPARSGPGLGAPTKAPKATNAAASNASGQPAKPTTAMSTAATTAASAAAPVAATTPRASTGRPGT